MKKRYIKFIFVLGLCLIIFAGCSAVPSSTPTPTPTSVEPTPTPIPYGEILDITVRLYDYPDFNWNITQILLEKFSLRLTEYSASTVGGPDIMVIKRVWPFEGDEYTVRQSCGKTLSVNYMEKIKDMPNYSSLLYSKEIFYELFEDEIDRHWYSLPLAGRGPYEPRLWLYNEKWFEKYNYSIPETMEELVDLLIYHKTNVDPSAQPIELYSLTKGVFATYGINYDEIIKRDSEGGIDYTFTDRSIIEALDMLRKIEDNSLARSHNNSDDYRNSDYSECAVLYDIAAEYTGGVETDGFSWKIFETQLSNNGTPYVLFEYSSGKETGFKFVNQIAINKNADKEVIDRLLDYIDWCSTDEGILASKFGFEGTDYRLDENGKIVLLKELDEISPAAIPVATYRYENTVLQKYGYNEQGYYKDYSELYAEKLDYVNNNDITILYQPEITLVPTYQDKKLYTKVVNISKQFVSDYIDGIKTADDFDEYLSDLEEAGLDDLLDVLNDHYLSLDEKYKDYLPDSLK